MLSRLIDWIFRRGQKTPPTTHVDPVALDVSRRQWAVAKRLSRHTDQTPQELLDYHRADRLWARKR